MRQERRKQLESGLDHFPEILGSLRRQRGWTQREVAERTGIRATQITRYEKGQSLPTADALKLLADCFEVPIDSLITGHAAAFEDKALLDQFQRVARLPEDDRELIKRIVEAFLLKRELQEFVARVRTA